VKPSGPTKISKEEIQVILDKVALLFLEKCHQQKRAQTFRRNLITKETLKKGIKVMNEERTLILGLIDHLVDDLKLNTVEIFPLLTKYGQKQQEVLQLDQLVLMAADGIRVMLHPAVTIRAKDSPNNDLKKTSLLWSRSALRELIGQRGTLYSALSLAAASNYQTNLDGRPLSVNKQLKRVFSVPEAHIAFMQLYADTPHIKVQHLMEHPIAGLLSCCGLLHKDVSYNV